MERRKRNNIIIGTLCAVLVLMGVGYAILSTTLNIGGTANIKGDFDIHFTRIEKSSSTITDTTLLSTMDNGTGITENTSNHEGTFTAVLQKPTDYVIYDVVVANTGSIDGYLTFTFGDKHDNFDYYKDFYSVEFIRDDVTPEIKADILQNGTFTDSEVLVNTTGERTYKIKVTFKENATSFPDSTTNGDFECTLNLTYSQQAPGGNSGANEQESTEKVWRVDSNGLVISYNPDDFVNGTLTIPAVDVDNNPIRSIGPNSFLDKYNVAVYERTGVIFDEDNYDNLSAILTSIGCDTIYKASDFGDDVSLEGLELFYIDPSVDPQNIQESDFQSAQLLITILDLRNASNLTEIESQAFEDNTIEEIKFNNALQTIGSQAFRKNNIKSLVISSSVVTIENGAFDDNGMSYLDLSGATGLRTIDKEAFVNNNLTGNIYVPSSVTNLSSEAFDSGVTVVRSQ